jgi:6-phosphogluconolactonase
MPFAPHWHEFATPDALAETLAGRVAEMLSAGIRARQGATLAVSGGTTPGRFFDALSRRELDWAQVVVTLVDERFVPPSSERSNERLVRERLLVNEARLARFIPLAPRDMAGDSLEEAARAAEAGIALLLQPFDVVVLGMGADGHTASFFPDAENLDELTDPAQPRCVLPVRTVAGGEPRLTLTMPLIVGARLLALHIQGAEKRATLERALSDEKPTMPIRRVVDAAPTPLRVYWTA